MAERLLTSKSEYSLLEIDRKLPVLSIFLTESNKTNESPLSKKKQENYEFMAFVRERDGMGKLKTAPSEDIHTEKSLNLDSKNIKSSFQRPESKMFFVKKTRKLRLEPLKRNSQKESLKNQIQAKLRGNSTQKVTVSLSWIFIPFR